MEQFHRLWAARHAAWTQAASDHGAAGWQSAAGLVREHGRVWRGVDGATYTHADYAGPPGTVGPAVIVRNSAGQTETVAFGDRAAARAWLAGRARDGTGPLPTTADGPACRTAWEEAVLARLLADPHDDQLRALAAERAWTSHLRAELHLAMRPGYIIKHPDQNQVRSSFAYRMLRAPGWALALTGWPDAHHAMRYLDRLAATPVTKAQALTAAQALAAADTIRATEAAAAGASRASRHLPSQTRRTLDAPAPRPVLAAPPPMLVPPPPLPGLTTPALRR